MNKIAHNFIKDLRVALQNFAGEPAKEKECSDRGQRRRDKTDPRSAKSDRPGIDLSTGSGSRSRIISFLPGTGSIEPRIS